MGREVIYYRRAEKQTNKKVREKKRGKINYFLLAHKLKSPITFEWGGEKKVKHMSKFPDHWVSNSSLKFVEFQQICFLYVLDSF